MLYVYKIHFLQGHWTEDPQFLAACWLGARSVSFHVGASARAAAVSKPGRGESCCQEGSYSCLWPKHGPDVPLSVAESKAHPEWCGSVGWASTYKLKGHWFKSRSGHKPGFPARFPVRGVWEATGWCLSLTSVFLFLSFSLPSPLSENE